MASGFRARFACWHAVCYERGMNNESDFTSHGLSELVPAKFGTLREYAARHDERAPKREFNMGLRSCEHDRLGGYGPVPEIKSLPDYLRELAMAGARKRWGDPLPTEARMLMEFELNVILGRGEEFVAYLLDVKDIVDEARRMGAVVGPGRGSSPSSGVVYALGITSIDPLEHGLLFERFVTPEQPLSPSIMVEFDEEGFGNVVEYIKQKHGLEYAERIVKDNLFGMPELTIQRNCLELSACFGPEITLEDIPLPEPKEFAYLCVSWVLRQKWMAQELAVYEARRNGTEAVGYAHPILEQYLAESQGLIVYQEQVMMMARRLAGFTRRESVVLRKALLHKKTDVLAELRPRFIAGCLENRDFRVGAFASESKARASAESIWRALEAAAWKTWTKAHVVAQVKKDCQTRWFQENARRNCEATHACKI